MYQFLVKMKGHITGKEQSLTSSKTFHLCAHQRDKEDIYFRFVFHSTSIAKYLYCTWGMTAILEALTCCHIFI